jgi:hypothetical protein
MRAALLDRAPSREMSKSTSMIVAFVASGDPDVQTYHD